MSLEVIYVVRHGFRSTWSVDPKTGVYSASFLSPTGIPADPALTFHGSNQAQELGSHLMTLDPPIDVVYSSPYFRCLETIDPFVKRKRRQLEREGMEDNPAVTSIRPEYGLCEFFGAAPFEHPIPAPPEKLKSLFSTYDDTYVSALAPSRNGETIQALYERVAAAVNAIIERCDLEGRRAAVLCTHAAVVIALGRVLTGRIPDDVETTDFHAYTCGLSTYRRKNMPRSMKQTSTSESPDPMGAWECERNSDCSFLSDGAERGWWFSGDESFAGTGSMSRVVEGSKL
ncbi:histidine phosphatase superfamily [Thelonectria olida]|uniref:Histidine phosphatase superfamily n=1 Tax=Thelonectria olida TaxID=1576542 RepID=A0A9P8WDM2_9HYPO|nr:histidine phosphatase superfamily [Thelonectria olida]